MRGILIHVNQIIKILTVSDVLLWGGYNMMNALVAIYLEEKIGAIAIETITIGVSIYLVSRSIVQIPIADMLDRKRSFLDETWSITFGCFLAGICIYLFIFIQKPWHLYLIQVFMGIAIALNLPAWRKTMARFLDKGYEALEYTIYDIFFSLFVAVMTVIGGYLVESYGGFEALFVVAGTIPIFGGFITLYLLKNKRIKHQYK